MQLVELNSPDQREYDQFITRQPGGSFLQSWEWGEWQAELGRSVKRFKITDESGEWVGTAQVVEMPAGGGRSYLYVPYGPVLAKGENVKFLISNFQIALQKQFPKSIFIRIEPKVELGGLTTASNIKKSHNIQPGKTLVLDLTKGEEQLLGEMHNKTRYNIKVAQKHGVVVSAQGGAEALRLIAETSKRQGFVSQGFGYYEKLVRFFQNHEGALKLYLYQAQYQGKVVASSIMVDFGNTRTYLFGGSSQEHKNVMAPYLLHWQAVGDARHLGLTSYDFWGIETASGQTPGFVRFKLGFGGTEVQYMGAHDVIRSKLWYTIYTIGRKINRLLR